MGDVTALLSWEHLWNIKPWWLLLVGVTTAWTGGSGAAWEQMGMPWECQLGWARLDGT